MASSTGNPMAALLAAGPPYPPQTALLGGQPTTNLDDPISAVLLVFFIAAAAFNMTVFQVNRRRDHKFVMSGLLFGFCMARIVALTMRIVWASRPTNVSIAIAANVFTAAGVVLLFIVNLIFAQRLLRAWHPALGWHRAANLSFTFLYFSVAASLVMVITVTVQSFFTLDAETHRIDRDVQLFAATYLAVLAFMPLPIALGAWLIAPLPRRVEKFGAGRFRTKVRLVVFTAALLSLGAGFRVGVGFAPRPLSDPAWYHSKACYYCFNYVIELVVVYAYALSRFDRRFHVPDGASGPGDYAAGRATAAAAAATEKFGDRINTEAEAYAYEPEAPGTGSEQEQLEKQWESGARRELAKEAEGEAV